MSKEQAPNSAMPTIEVLTDDVKAKIDHWVSKYPAEKKRSAILSALTITQKANGGWLNEALVKQVADYLEISVVEAFEVVTFYSMFDLKPVGKYKISVCTNIACLLCGCEPIMEHLKKRLNVDVGGTTQDGRYTLKSVECLAACVQAPAMMINDDYHEYLTAEKVDKILDELE